MDTYLAMDLNDAIRHSRFVPDSLVTRDAERPKTFPHGEVALHRTSIVSGWKIKSFDQPSSLSSWKYPQSKEGMTVSVMLELGDVKGYRCNRHPSRDIRSSSSEVCHDYC